MNDRPLSDDFDERFLSAYGLGDPDNPLRSSSNASITSNRENKLEKQAKESPWLAEMITSSYSDTVCSYILQASIC